MRFASDIFHLAATDLSNHLSCYHLTQLDRKAARGELRKPFRNDPSLDVLAQRGREHEAAYVKHVRKTNPVVVDLRGQSVQATLDAMAKGVDVIVQARLEEGQWNGYADILLKTSGDSKFGNWAYEVYDTKLAQQTRAATILQLCLYTDLLAGMQGMAPVSMYVVKPGDDFPTESYFYAEFQAYYRLVKKNLAEIMAGPEIPSYPEPVQHCDVCGWWQVCNKQRHDDDYLSLVAGIRTLHIEELRNQKITTLAGFAEKETLEIPQRGNKETFLRKQWQARMQLKGRSLNQLIHESLPIEADRGLNRLPEPSKGDIYFDIEGDAFFPGGSLEYLLGYAFRKEDGTLEYVKLWATDRLQERRAFEALMQFIVSRWKQFPDMHIYHFAPYEPTAIKRMCSVHALFEQDVDALLRAERFVDLHAIFKEALLASVERYSLKDLEKFTTYTRKAELHDAGIARKNVECALELNDFKTLPKQTLEVVELYNEDDCLATEALHVWLEALRDSLIKKGVELKRPVPKEAEASNNLKELEIRSQALFKALTQQLPEDRELWTEEDHARWLLAHQVDYFRREDKSAWWEYFRVHTMEHEELLNERKAVTGLRYVRTLPLKPKERTPTHQYSYPPQEVALSQGDDLREVNGEKIGSVESVSLENNTINIKKTGTAIDRHPFAVHVFERIDPAVLWTSIMNLAEAIDESGLKREWPYHASKDLLMRRKPKMLDGFEGAYMLQGEDAIDAAIRIALNLDRSILPIQGPPGTGKTHTGAKMIIALVKAKKRVGVTAISHRVIITLFEKVKELSRKEDFEIGFVHKVTNKLDYIPEWVVQVKEHEKVIEGLNAGKVAGGTAWLWSDNKSNDVLDYLFIDEAGQMSLSQALAASRAAKNIILLGDPQQLEQPQKGAHPEGSDVAALTYLLEGKPTMPEGKGLFLGVTRRMHPNISRFTSEIFYEGKLKSLPGLENQVIIGGTPFDGAGLFYVPVAHSGNQNRSFDEVEVVSGIVARLLKTGRWTDAGKKTRLLQKEDILIVAPYNAQVAALIERLPGMPIGTVDKFQGKEAPVVIYSMTSSSVQEAPRGMAFLFSPNRLNVATSRAKSVCILVASPRLLEPDCNSIDQMRWANGLCRLRELAQVL